MLRRSPGSTPAPSDPTTVYATTSLPACSPVSPTGSSGSTPHTSVPRIIGVCVAESPTPLSDHMSWWFTVVACTAIRAIIGVCVAESPTPLSDHMSWWFTVVACTAIRAQPAGSS